MQVQQDFPPLLRGVLQGLRILLVEDAPDSSYLLTRFLGVAGAIVETAEDGAEAVSKANHLLHDVILMDIQMPIMDGFTATRILRERGYQRPIVALTASAQPWEFPRVGRTLFDAYLAKPISQRALVHALMALR